MIPDKLVVLFHAEQLCQVVNGILPGFAALQAVGVVVGGQNDQGIIGDPGFLQLVQQGLHGVFQFQIGGKVALDNVGVVHILHLVPVFPGHGVALLGVLTVAADGHVVDAEGLLINVLGNGDLHHLQVAFRPGAFDLQAAVPGDELVIAQMGVGIVAVVEVLQMVMVGNRIVALFLQLMAHGQEHILVGDDVHGAAALGGNQTQQVGKLTGGGAGTPGGLIVFLELDALGGHAVQGGGQLRVNDLCGEGLGGDEDQVLAPEHPGVGVLAGGGQGIDVIVDGSHSTLSLGLGSGGKVDGKHIAGIFRFLRVILRIGFGRNGFRCFRRNLWDGKIRGIGGIQMVGGIQQKAHAQSKVPNGTVKVIGFVENIPIPGQTEHRTQTQSTKQDAAAGQKSPAGPGDLRFPAEDAVQHRRQQDQQDPAKIGGDHCNGLSQKVLCNAAGTGGHGLHRHKVLEGFLQHEFCHDNDGKKDGNRGCRLLPSLARQKGRQQSQHTPQSKGEQHHGQDPAGLKGIVDPQVQQDFAVYRHTGGKQPAGQGDGSLFRINTHDKFAPLIKMLGHES